MPSLRTYDGAVALITGGASGIGRALAAALAARGATVVLADRQLDLAQQVAAELRASGADAAAHELDVRDFPAVKQLADEVNAQYGRIDYFFNNAGIGIGGEVRLYSLDDWYQVLDVNLRGVVHGVQAVYHHMIDQGFGHIVNTASMAGLMPGPMVASYCLTKHAVVGLSNSLRIEAAEYGVRVSVLCPGVIRTAILEGGGHYGKQLTPANDDLLKKTFERLRPLPADRFAQIVLKHLARNRGLIITPARWRLVWWLNRISPALGMAIARREYRRSRDLMAGDDNAASS